MPHVRGMRLWKWLRDVKQHYTELALSHAMSLSNVTAAHIMR